jgi:hypothetical protein
MFMEVNTHVHATREKKNLHDGTLVGRDVKEKSSGGQGAK